MKPRILVVDDDQAMCEFLAIELRSRGFDIVFELTADGALDLMACESFDAVVTDLRMRGMSGLDLCSRILESRPDIPVIVMTAFGSLETAVATIRAGACDFITKPFNIEELVIGLERAFAQRVLRVEMKRLEHAAGQVGRDPAQLVPMAVVERRYILHVLDVVGGDRSMAARILGYERELLDRRLESYGVPVGDDSG
jgi:two-component system response regulator HydG